MKPLFMFVRPPRPLWPFNGPSTAFWPPLAFASLAAAVREAVPSLQVAILDAPAMSMGWNTLEKQLRRLQPKYVAIGEEAVSCVEGLRIAQVARQLGAKVIAGGCFFSHLAAEVLSTGLIDIVVHGEGELTLVELLQNWDGRDNSTLQGVAGISFVHEEEVVFTGHRPLISDLDRLPFPAYDLLPVEKYGIHSRNHPRLAAIELGRGCTHGCRFCVLWRQMGRFQGDRPVPCLRVKSPERLLEEVRILINRFERRYLAWVDPCFNADPKVPAQLADLLRKNDCAIGQSAWVRADYVLRDHASGALESCVRAGWNEAYLGLERMQPSELAQLSKGNLNGEATRAAQLLASKYPEVVTIGSLIYGFDWDTRDSVRAMFRQAHELPVDEFFFIPLTPLPGTPYWKSQMWDPSGRRFRNFDFLPRPESGNLIGQLSAEIAKGYVLSWPPCRAKRMITGLISRNRRRRRIVRHIFQRATPVLLSWAMHRQRASQGGMFYPAWYES